MCGLLVREIRSFFRHNWGRKIFCLVFSGLFLGIFHKKMSKTLQNHQLAYLGGKKTPLVSKNNIKLKLLFPIVSKIVVLFPCMSHFWVQYVISLPHEETYLLCSLVGHIIYQRIGPEEEFTFTSFCSWGLD